ncbi:hypothetical protein TURU_087851 [Turdus rufiventris]|nr:hypothetical protein TURU_087851 [Turdus rufiventris]
MYVTMMMTDQIPLELPPLLNGEVAMMPHIVNGDGSQQLKYQFSMGLFWDSSRDVLSSVAKLNYLYALSFSSYS